MNVSSGITAKQLSKYEKLKSRLFGYIWIRTLQDGCSSNAKSNWKSFIGAREFSWWVDGDRRHGGWRLKTEDLLVQKGFWEERCQHSVNNFSRPVGILKKSKSSPCELIAFQVEKMKKKHKRQKSFQNMNVLSFFFQSLFEGHSL